MERSDIIIIGGGLLGCFSARALAEYDLKAIVLEKREDVCTGVSKANTGIVYTGGDTAPGTLKTRLCVKANRDFDLLCRELDVPFSRCGSLMLSFGERAERVLDKKYALALENGVPGAELLSRDQVLAREPNIAPGVTKGLYLPGTGTVNPWELGIAAFENARANGVDFHFCEEVLSIAREGSTFTLETSKERYHCRAIINCAGLNAAAVREFTEMPAIRLIPSGGDYLVLDSTVKGFLNHVIFHEPETKGKGLTLVPTVDGNLLVGPTERPEGGEDFATTCAGLELLYQLCAQVTPALPLDKLIRSFGALRPNPFYVHQENGVWVPEDKSISSFTVLEEEGLFSLVGIKTPGLTCAAELGKYAAKKAAAHVGCDRRNSHFDPIRRAIPHLTELDIPQRSALIAQDSDHGHIVCRCREVSLGEVKEAIRRGACTVDGVKRRTGAGMGRCQGGYCMQTVLEALAKGQGLPAESVSKDGGETRILYGTL